MGAFDYKADPSATVNDAVAVERIEGNRVIRLRNTLEGLVARANGSGDAQTIAAWLGAVSAATGATNAVATAVGAAPAVTGLTASVSRAGPFFKIDFTLAAVSITVTDGAGSGSHGALKIFDFVAGAVSFLGCRQDYTAFAEGVELTGEAGDAVFEIGVGTTAISAAADGTLGDGVNENVGQAVAVTLSEGTGVGTAVDGAKTTALNGTATAVDLNLNWSGTAATIDATSTIAVTGTITVVGVMLGDD